MLLIQRKFLCIHFLHVTDLMPVFFQRNNIGKQKLLRRRKILYPYHLRRMWKRISIYSSGFQVGHTTYSTCISEIAWWFVLCCAMAKMSVDSLLLCKNIRNTLVTPRATLAYLPFKSVSSKFLLPCSSTHTKTMTEWTVRIQNYECVSMQ